MNRRTGNVENILGMFRLGSLDGQNWVIGSYGELVAQRARSCIEAEKREDSLAIFMEEATIQGLISSEEIGHLTMPSEDPSKAHKRTYDTLRAALFGDSYTQGMAAACNYARILEHKSDAFLKGSPRFDESDVAVLRVVYAYFLKDRLPDVHQPNPVHQTGQP